MRRSGARDECAAQQFGRPGRSMIVAERRARDHDLASAGERDINRPTPLRISCSECLRHVVRLAAVLRSLESPIAATSMQVLRTHFGRELVERLRTESGVLGAGSDRSEAVSLSLQRSDYVRRKLGWITARGFVDRIRDDPLDGANRFFSHALLLATPHTDNALHIPWFAD